MFNKEGNKVANFIETLRKSTVISVVKEEKFIDKALESDSKIVFLLAGNITNLKTYVDHIKKKEKMVFIHVEMIGGLNCDKNGMDFIAKHVKPTGIVSTKKTTLKLAKSYKLITVQRIFAIDTDAINTSIEVINELKPDLVEIMPARMPEIINIVTNVLEVPVIAGGLVRSRGHIEDALRAGAIAVASGTPDIWKEKF